MSDVITTGAGGSMEQFRDADETNIPRELLGAATARIQQDGTRVDMDGGTRVSVDLVGAWEAGDRLYSIRASRVAYNFDRVFRNIGHGSLNDTAMSVEIGWIARDGSEGGIAHFDPRDPLMHTLFASTQDEAEGAARLERWLRLGGATDVAGVRGKDEATTAELRRVIADLARADLRIRPDLIDTTVLRILAGGVPMGLDAPRAKHKVTNAPEGSRFHSVSWQQRARILAAPLLRMLRPAVAE